MGAVAIRSVSEVRRWRRSLVMASLIGGVAGAVAVAALCGAARTDAALGRFLDRHAFPDVAMDAYLLDEERLERVAALDVVDELGGMIYTAQQPRGLGLVAGLDVVGAVAMTDAQWRTVDRFVSVDGRLPERVGEVAIDEALADRFDIVMGDELVIDAMAPDQNRAIFTVPGGPEPAGRSHTATVVGVTRTAETELEGDDHVHGLYLPREFGDAYSIAPPVELGGVHGDVLGFRPELRATLVDGDADRDRFVAAVTDIYDGATDTTASASRFQVEDNNRPDFEIQRDGLRLFALAAALAGVVAFGHVVARTQALSAADDATLAAIGLRPSQRRAVLWLLGGVAVAGSAVAIVVGAVVLAPWSVLGSTGRIEGGALFVVPFGVAAAATAAVVALYGLRVLVSGYTVIGRGTGGHGVGVVPRLAAGMARSPQALVGTRLALHRWRGPRAVPVVPVLVGAVVGVAGLTAALVATASLDHLTDTPRLYGNPWDLQVVAQAVAQDRDLVEQTTVELVADERTDAVTVAFLGLAELDGLDIGVEQVEAAEGDLLAVVLDGRLPEARTEIALDRQDLDRLGKGIGDQVAVGGGASLEIVGVVAGRSPALVPVGADIGPDESFDMAFYVDLAEGVDPAEYVEGSEGIVEAYGPEADAEPVAGLDEVRALPGLLAVLVGTIAVSAVAHGLAVTVRRRRVDLGALHALGYRRGRLRRAILWQTTTIGVVAVVLGVPVGLIVGTWVWSHIAGDLDAAFEAVVPARTLVVALALGGFAVVGAAILPARRAGRVSASETLRSE